MASTEIPIQRYNLRSCADLHVEKLYYYKAIMTLQLRKINEINCHSGRVPMHQMVHHTSDYDSACRYLNGLNSMELEEGSLA